MLIGPKLLVCSWLLKNVKEIIFFLSLRTLLDVNICSSLSHQFLTRDKQRNLKGYTFIIISGLRKVKNIQLSALEFTEADTAIVIPSPLSVIVGFRVFSHVLQCFHHQLSQTSFVSDAQYNMLSWHPIHVLSMYYVYLPDLAQ